jgi:hypothetical protein
MTAKSRAQEQLELYQRYSGIARAVANSDIRLAYEGLARQALLYAAKLDPAAMANATACETHVKSGGPDASARATGMLPA